MMQNFPYVPRLSPYFEVTSYGSGRPFWTVAIEWWMYLSFGFLYFKFIKPEKTNYLNLIILFPLFFVALSNLYGRGNGLTMAWYSGAFLLVFLQQTRKMVVRNNQIFIISLLAILLLCYCLKINHYNCYDFRISFLLMLLLYSMLEYARRNKEIWLFQIIWVENLIKKTADYSYSLYLIHYTLIVFFLNAKLNILANKVVFVIVLFILSNIIAFFFARYTERYNNKFRFFLKKRLL